jgi:hypothetical protein
MTRALIGCCGAFCGTCRALADQVCRGCTSGYDTGQRDLSRAKCRIKRCAIRQYGAASTCADCPDYATCDILKAFYAKRGVKYRRYQRALAYIRSHGYDAFFTHACHWHGAYGRLPGDD